MNNTKQLLQQLPEPYRSQALENFDEEFYEEHEKKEEPVTTPKKALACSFGWQETEQGYNYWNKLFNEL